MSFLKHTRKKIICSQPRTILFPTWERFIPNLGTFHSQGGNKFLSTLTFRHSHSSFLFRKFEDFSKNICLFQDKSLSLQNNKTNLNY